MTGTAWPRIMLIGKNGQIGYELHRTLETLGEVVALDRRMMDLSDADKIREYTRNIQPDIIVNAAAYTAVDRAEEEADTAMSINGVAPGVLAEEAKRINAFIVHYSTDYVFDGTKTTPYTEEDHPNPLNVYGRTKLSGEQAIQAVGVPHIIIRTSWVYGLRGKNFMLTVLGLAREREELKIVDDQIGSPTTCQSIAEVTAQILSAGKERLANASGTYHMTASGSTSWFGFAKAILESDPKPHEQSCKHILPIPTSAYPTPARRPVYSVLSNTKLNNVFGIILAGWEQGLKSALVKMNEKNLQIKNN